jgi:hypothetical protein
MKRLTQEERVLAILKQTGRISTTTAVYDMRPPVLRLGAVIYNLRKKGHDIATVQRTPFAIYNLNLRDVEPDGENTSGTALASTATGGAHGAGQTLQVLVRRGAGRKMLRGRQEPGGAMRLAGFGPAVEGLPAWRRWLTAQLQLPWEKILT